MSDYFGKETPKLGFGLMRLPKKGLHTDIEQVKHRAEAFGSASYGASGSGFCAASDQLCGLGEPGRDGKGQL